MKKKNKTGARTSALYKLIKPHLANKRNVLSEDLRKLGIYAIGLGLVAYIVAGDKITNKEALAIGVFGLLWWATGLLLSKTEEK